EHHDGRGYRVEPAELMSNEALGEGGREIANGLTLGHDKSDATENRHGAERDDEGMDAESDDHAGVDATAHGSGPDAYQTSNGNNQDSGCIGACAGRNVMLKKHCCQDGGKEKDRADRQIDPAGDDHDRRSDGHHREVGGLLEKKIQIDGLKEG